MRNKHNRIYGLLMVGCMALSCTPDLPQATAAAQPFFSLKGFFEAEITRLGETVPRANKLLRIAEKEEIQKGLTLDFATELTAFKDSDINRPSWADKYTIDSVLDASGYLNTLEYLAKDSTLYTRHIRLDFETDGTVKNCMIRNRLTNLISDFRQSLQYDPKTGYTITVYQGLGDDARQPVTLVVEFDQ